MRPEYDPSMPNVYDGIEDTGEVPASGTPVEIGMDLDVRSPGDLQDAMDSGKLDKIAANHPDRALGFKFKGPRQVSLFVADHDHAIKVVVAGAAAAATAVAGIILFERKKGK